tara:strand:+ start:28 stop:1386 length:1359 start_codon:yes stop_codon:yes gene_type:complete
MADINLGVGGANSASGGYDIDNSVKLEADNDERFTRTPSSAGNRKTWTFSAWVKRTELGANQILISAADTYLYFGSDDKIHCNFRPASENFFLSTNRLFRDTSAWYHIVVQCDTTDSTAADRAKLYINGVRETSYSNSTYNNMSQNLDTSMNNTIEHMIGRYSSSDDYRMSGYISEFHLVDGTALTPTSFGEYDDDSGIWKPKEYTGSYGTNGFYLDFADATDLGDDESGNGNDWTEVNITAADQATDTPTNNFCTLNPLIPYGYPTTISEGAVKGVDNSVGLGGAAGTIAVNSGKWYWEFKSSVSTTIMGIQDIEADTSTSNNAHEIPYTMGVYLLGEYNYAADSTGRNDGSTSGLIFDADRRYAVALNLDDDEITYYQLGSSVGTFSLDGLAGLYVRPFASCAGTLQWNFGGYTTIGSYSNTDANGYGAFEYTPPSGYYALCSKNLAEYG